LFGVSDYKGANTATANDHELQRLPQYVQVSTACRETVQHGGSNPNDSDNFKNIFSILRLYAKYAGTTKLV
jgi:hypothetical protein|tara:strand:- start:173 stop:385 length:213 start_codon:yes stop_codon:yes gene_type:complete